MGLMRLAVQNRRCIPPDGLDRVCICGPDDLHGELPWFASAYFSNNHLVIERLENDSGWIYVPWRIAGRGEMLLGTATLVERPHPYQLEVELARGTVNRLRNQLFQWGFVGLEIPDSLWQIVQKATRHFSRAATSQQDPAAAAEYAETAIASALDGMDALVSIYSAQAIAVRRSQAPGLNTLLGIQLGDQMSDLDLVRQLPAAFNLATARLGWASVESSEGTHDWKHADAQIEWSGQAGLKVCGGPLLEFSDRGIPDWAYLWEGDFASLRDFMLEHVRRTVRRYRGRVQIWQVASRICSSDVLALSEEQRLQIVAEAIATTRKIDMQTPVIISFDQPWGEYLASKKLDLAPLHFADALVRADLGLSGLGLEINLGYQPGGSSFRNPLAYSQLIDHWSHLELPLLVSLTLPSSSGEDLQANPKIRTCGASGDEDMTPETQNEWIGRHLPMLLGKASVQAILWNQLSDCQPHEFPHGGIFDANSHPKPVFKTLCSFRSEYLL